MAQADSSLRIMLDTHGCGRVHEGRLRAETTNKEELTAAIELYRDETLGRSSRPSWTSSTTRRGRVT